MHRMHVWKLLRIGDRKAIAVQCQMVIEIPKRPRIMLWAYIGTSKLRKGSYLSINKGKTDEMKHTVGLAIFRITILRVSEKYCMYV